MKPTIRRFVFLALLPPFLAATPPASAPAPSLPGIIAGLSSDKYQEREAAQRQLERVDPENVETLRKLIDTETDAEARTRLDARVTAMDAYHAMHPATLSVDFRNADLKTVLDALNQLLGGNFMLPFSSSAATAARLHNEVPKSVIADARFTLMAENQPFWEIIRRLTEQAPFILTGADQLAPQKAPPKMKGRAQTYHYDAISSLMLIARVIDSQGGAGSNLSMFRLPRALDIARNAGAKIVGVDTIGKPDPNWYEFNFSFFADPRVRVQKYDLMLRLTEITDSNGNNLLPLVEPYEDLSSSLGTPTQTGTPFALFKLPADHGGALATVKGIFNVTLALAEKKVILNEFTPGQTQSVTLPANVLQVTTTIEQVQGREILVWDMKPSPLKPAGENALTGEYVSPLPILVRVIAPDGAISSPTPVVRAYVLRIGRENFPKGSKVEITYPTRTANVNLPFEFKNLPLP